MSESGLQEQIQASRFGSTSHGVLEIGQVGQTGKSDHAMQQVSYAGRTQEKWFSLWLGTQNQVVQAGNIHEYSPLETA